MKLFLFIIFQFIGLNFSFAEFKQNSFYGYFQTDFIHSSNPDHDYGFLLRRVNFIGDFLPNPKTRLLSDIEFEEGADISASEIKGNIKISRLFVEQSLNKFLKLKVGRFLTPFGLYNEIHDFSVTYYAIEVPILYQPLVFIKGTQSTRLISKYNTGVWLSGNTSGSNKMEYDIYFGNGRDEEQDGSDSNKSQSFGFKWNYIPGSKKNLKFGLSYYQDINKNGLVGAPNDPEKLLNLHFQYEFTNYQLQSEVLSTQYHNTHNTSQTTLGSYIQVATNLSEKNTLYYQYGEIKYNLQNQDHLFENLIGTGYLINPQLIVKLEYQNFMDDTSAYRTYNETYLSAAMAF